MKNSIFRVIELVLILAILPVLLPLWFLHWCLAKLEGKSFLTPVTVIGLNAKQICVWEAQALAGFAHRLFNSQLLRLSPRLISVLLGRVSLVGPAMIAEARVNALNPQERARFAVKPGLVNSYFLRESVNIAFADESKMALDDMALTSPLKKLAMVLRGLAALILRGNPNGPLSPTLEMFGLSMVNETRGEAVERIVRMAMAEQRSRIAFVNPGCVNIAMRDAGYRAILNASDLIFPDGIGIKIACRYLGQTMGDNLNGTDLFPAICDRLEHTDHGIYLLGAQPGVVDAMVENVRAQWPGLTISGYHHGYLNDPDLEMSVIADINQSRASLLFVAMGVPGQELWIDRNWHRLETPVSLGVGGLFDFVSGRIPRAPQWVREIGMEWAYRLMREPRRLWRRYVIGNIVFLWHMVRYHR